MFSAVQDLKASVNTLVNQHFDLDNLVVIEASPDWPDELLIGTLDAQHFYETHRAWMSRHMVLNELFSLRDFVRILEADGYRVVFAPSAKPILERYARWSAPMPIDGFTCPGGGDLYPFQTFTIRRALERSVHPKAVDRLWFCNWTTGAGKSLFACAGAQELYNRRQVDVVLAFTMMKLKHNLCQFFTDTTQLDAVVVDGTKPKRIREYAAGHDVIILNYERCWADFDALTELTRGKRVLFICDEASKVLNHERLTKTRRHLNKLIQGSRATVWPMSASVVNHNPLRYRDVYNLAGGKDRDNPLGSKREFERRYADRITDDMYGTQYEWSLARLHEVRHRIADRTQAVRKTDPSVAPYFKGIQTIPFKVELSPQDRRLYRLIQDEARTIADQEDGSLAGPYRLLQYVTNIPEALTRTGDALGASLAAEHPDLVTAAHCNKLEILLDQIEAIQEQGDKVVVFSKWTNMGMLLLAPHVAARGIPHVLHYGVGQSNAESQEAQRKFKTDPAITLFLSSDAGAWGLNLPEARYIIHYEPSYSYDLMMQRSSRIDRADSKLDGMTAFVYITEGTHEERVWEVCDERRRLAAAVQGTAETLSYAGRAARSEQDNLRWLIWGQD